MIRRVLLIGVISAGALTGCGQDEPAKKSDRIDLLPPRTVTQKPYTTSARPIVITEGELPLVWLSTGPATLQFFDVTANQSIGDARVEKEQIVKLDAARGIAVGQSTVRLGPLPKDHRYSIQLMPSTVSETRNETAPILPAPHSRQDGTR